MPFQRFNAGWTWIPGGLVLLLMWGRLAAEQESPKAAPAKDQPLPFTISRETTRITQPLMPDGTVDYAAALNARMSEGVTPENNAGVLLIQAIGANRIPEAKQEAFFKALGTSVPSHGEPLLLHYTEFVKQHLKQKQTHSEVKISPEPYWDQQTQSMKRPWSRKEFPLVAEWLDVNTDTLKITLNACQSSRLFFPMIVMEGEILLGESLPLSVSDIRELARLLTSSSMLALHEGQTGKAVEYQLACHRLGLLVGQQPTVIDALVSYAINAMASEADVSLVASIKLSQQQLGDYRRQIQALPPPPTVRERYDFADRLVDLDTICQVAMKKLDPKQVGIPNQDLRDRMFFASTNWDAILKRFNKEYDEMVATMKHPTYARRQVAMDQWNERWIRETHWQPGKLKELGLVTVKLIGGNPPREEINRHVGNQLLREILPAIRSASDTEFRAHVRRDLTIIALALAEYQREHGNYPETLDDLSPKYLKTIPKDRFTEKPLRYQRQEAGFLLYSLGANGTDDKGELNADGADDIAIRVPIPSES